MIPQPIYTLDLKQQQRPQSGRNSFTLDPSEDNTCKDPSEDDSEETEAITNPGYVKHTHTCVDQIASLGVVCVTKSNPVCVCAYFRESVSPAQNWDYPNEPTKHPSEYER